MLIQLEDSESAEYVAMGLVDYLPALLEEVRRNCYDEKDECFDGYWIADRKLEMGDVIIGSQDPKKLIDFAKNMKSETLSHIRDVLMGAKGIESLDDSISQILEKVEKSELDTFSLVNACSMMNNEPCFQSPCAVCTYLGIWNCWPDEYTLTRIIEGPESWVVVDVMMHD